VLLDDTVEDGFLRSTSSSVSSSESTKDVRTGINATGLYWETPDGPVLLFYTGRHHAGEIGDQLLRHRPLSSPKLVNALTGLEELRP
jgi:hypothetical protein